MKQSWDSPAEFLKVLKVLPATKVYPQMPKSHTFIKNKAKAISHELLELNFKNKLEETGKTRWNVKKQKNWKKKNTEKGEETE